MNRILIHFLHSAGQFQEATELVEHALELSPRDPYLHLHRGRILAAQGRFDEAIAVLEGIKSEDRLVLKHLGWVYARAGKIEKARVVLAEFDELSRQAYVPPLCFALVHAGLGDANRAFEWLEKGLFARGPHVCLLKSEPEWESIRDDPRWDELISQISYFAKD